MGWFIRTVVWSVPRIYGTFILPQILGTATTELRIASERIDFTSSLQDEKGRNQQGFRPLTTVANNY